MRSNDEYMDKVTGLFTIDGMRVYEVYCGNWSCRSRTELWLNKQGIEETGRRFDVTELDLIDGEVWLCATCRP